MSDAYDPVRHLGNPQHHQRMYDFERDVLRVKNPLNTDFEFIYDSIAIIVPAGRTKDMERYLVRRFIWNMIGHIYNQFAEKKMKDAEEAFKRTHPDIMEDPYLINTQIYDKMKRADDKQFQKQVIKDCIVGLVSRFGANRVVAQKPQNGRLDPNTQLYEQLINDFKTVIPNTTEQPLAEVPLMADQTQPLESQPANVSEATI